MSDPIIIFSKSSHVSKIPMIATIKIKIIRRMVGNPHMSNVVKIPTSIKTIKCIFLNKRLLYLVFRFLFFRNQ